MCVLYLVIILVLDILLYWVYVYPNSHQILYKYSCVHDVLCHYLFIYSCPVSYVFRFLYECPKYYYKKYEFSIFHCRNPRSFSQLDRNRIGFGGGYLYFTKITLIFQYT